MHNLTSWAPLNKDEYALTLDKYITEECNKSDWSTNDNTEKMKAIEQIIIQVAVQNDKPKANDSPTIRASDVELQRAINGRKWYRDRYMYKEAAMMVNKAQKL